jgi:hypothetical protein
MLSSRTPYDPQRRRVLRALSLAGLTSLGAPALSMGQAKPDSARGAAPKTPAPAAAPGAPAAAEKPPEISEDARALAEIVKRRYGQHLTPEQLEAVTREIDGRLQGGKALRAAKLANGDEPDFTFHA